MAAPSETITRLGLVAAVSLGLLLATGGGGRQVQSHGTLLQNGRFGGPETRWISEPRADLCYSDFCTSTLFGGTHEDHLR